jgi:hypothetical protein
MLRPSRLATGRPKPFVFVIAVLGVALIVALAFESVYDVEVRTRRSGPSSPSQDKTESNSARHASPPLPLRLVDSGGVGVPLEGDWGADYSHDLRVFREVILREPPYVDVAALRRVDRQWRAYVERMLEYGNNAIVIPLFLELIDFSSLPRAHDTRIGRSVYNGSSPFRARHAAVRQHFSPLFDWTHQRGMQVFLSTDMLALTPPLAEYLRRLSPSSENAGINTSDSAVWEVYRAGLEELFDELPSIEGLVIRVGEAGSLYNTDGWDYQSEMAVRDAVSLRAMLRGLLPLFEARGKTLVLRSWSVGVGPIGRLHVDPRVYEAVLGDLDSPALIVSTKFSAGDFFSYLPLNPTLAGGRHRRLIELQAKPEFEGFGAFPNFLGEDHAQALRDLTSANPRIVGTYLWSQLGGPIRAGPRSLYPLHGFWLWTDANVYVASRLALDRSADVRQLARQWATDRFGGDARIAAAVARLLTQTRSAVRTGFYIRPFAEREVRLATLDLPPLMWIFDWDRLGGWHSLLSILYQSTGDSIDVAIEEGDAAAANVRRSRQELQRAIAAADPDRCGPVCGEAVRSLEYQETLFDALAAWRQAFLSYYRWLETSDRNAWHQWTAGRQRFNSTAARHMGRFGGDPYFPAFDLTSAEQTIRVATRGAWSRGPAAGLLIAVLTLFGIAATLDRRQARGSLGVLARLGSVAWIAGFAPWRLAHEPPDVRSFMVVTALGLVLVGFLAGAFAGFTTAWISAGLFFVIGSVGLALESTAIRNPVAGARGRLVLAAVGPLIPGSIVLLALVAYLGPLGFWYAFWTSPAFRVTAVTTLIAMMLWTAYGMFAARPGVGWHGRFGGSLVAAGAGLLAMTAVLPNWLDVLRFLDRPLNFAPATETMLFALGTYVGVNLDAGALPWILGTLLLATGVALSRLASGQAREPVHPVND